MGMIGNQPANNFLAVTKDTFNGNASSYTLSKAATTNGVAVYVENVRQIPTTAYSVSGTTLTFTATTPAGTGNVYVLHHNTPASTATHPAAQALTATSGTFSSDLTVDTSTLKVDSSNNRVGVGLTDPSDLFEVSNSADTPTRAIITAEDSSGTNQNAFIKTKAKGNYYEGLEMASTSGHIGMWGGYYSGSAILQARVGGSGINSSDVLAMQIDANGHVTMPNQSAFSVTANQQNNLPINASTTIQFANEIFDLNADFNTSNYTFTAPVTGKYMLNVNLRMDNVDRDHSYMYMILATSNREYEWLVDVSVGYSSDPDYLPFTINVLADMDASDTAVVKMHIPNAGSAQSDVVGSNKTTFSGFLAC